MAIVGTAYVEIHAISGSLDKDIAGAVDKAAKGANAKLKLSPSVDASKAEQELGKVDNAVKKAASSGGVLNYAMQRVRTQLLGVAQDGGPVASELEKASTQLTDMAPAALAAAAGVAVVIGAAYAGVAAFTGLADQVHRFQAISGSTAEDASRFVVGLRVIGQNAQSVGQALFRLSREAAGASKTLAEDGIVIARNSSGGLDLVKTFLNVADAYKKAGAGAAGSQVLFDAFGRQGAALAPILALDRKQLEDLFSEADKNHEVLRASDVNSALDYKIAVGQAKEAVKGLGVEVGRPSVKIFTGAVKLSTDVARGLGVIVSANSRIFSTFGGSAIASALGLNSMSSSESRAIETSKQLLTQTADLEKAVIGEAQATVGLQSAKAATTAADDAAAYSARQYQELLRQGPVDAQAVASARQQLSSATDTLTSAQDRLSKAEQALAVVEQGASPRDKERATLRLSEANNAVAHAQADLTKAQRSGHTSALDLSDAQNRLETAQIEAADAQDNLNTVTQQGTDGAPDTIAAQDAVTTAQKDVTKALQDQDSAAGNLRTAMAGDPDFSYKLAAARDAVATSTANAATAHVNLQTAALQAADAQTALKTAIDADSGAVQGLLTAFTSLAQQFGVPLTSLTGLLPSSTAASSVTPFATLVTPLLAAQAPPPSTSAAHHHTNTPARAGGGPTDAGYWYQVNEDGTEYFRSNSSGTVLPVGQTPQATGGDQRPIVQNFHGDDPHTTAALAAIYLGRELRTLRR